MHGAVDHLPLAVYSLLPELRTVEWPQEVQADCSNCPMALRDGEDPQTTSRPWFLADVKCCTYHPLLANYAVGRALRRDDRGSRKVRERLKDTRGVNAYGLGPPPGWSERYRANHDKFGQLRAFKCPYWVPGELSCSIWRDRNAICRTWFCKHVDGAHGHLVWVAMRAALRHCERRLAAWLVEQGKPPNDGAPPRKWVRWYRWCADRLDRATLAQLEPLMGETEIVAFRKTLNERLGTSTEMPDKLGPSVSRIDPLPDDRVRLSGYTFLNSVELPKTIFQLLSALDGETSWQTALQTANAALPDDAEPFDAALVEHLFRLAILEDRSAPARDDALAHNVRIERDSEGNGLVMHIGPPTE